MKNTLLNKLKFIKSASLLALFLSAIPLKAQQTITVFDGVLFYGGYAPVFTDEQLYEPMPPEILRHSNSKYARKLTDAELDIMGNTLDIDVTLEAACDNYDRLGHIYLVFAPKGASTYDPAAVERIEMARFVTPFMNKNNSPNNVDYSYTANNIAEILINDPIRAQYDLWVEFDVFGTTGAGETEVAGCSGHKDTFRGTLTFTSAQDSGIVYDDEMQFVPLLARQNLNNYNATDVPGETTRIINFNLDQQVEDMTLYLITSNHGANSGGEEYARRRHYVYLDGALLYEYVPGGKSCEPYRQVNTQGNGIYGASAKPLRGWIYWNNWCPGDRVPTHEVDLGTLAAGAHTLKIDVPTAEFVDGQGQIPVSVFLQNRASGGVPTCVIPTDVTGGAIANADIYLNWEEIGNAEEWEVLYGKIYNSQGQMTNSVLAEENYYQATDGVSEGVLQDNVSPGTVYQLFLRTNCGEGVNSNWSEPFYVQTQMLSVSENDVNSFFLYPNPVEGNLFLTSEGSEISEIALYDIQGREVLQKNIGSLNGIINMENMASGVYLLKVKIAETVKTYKIQKK